MPKPPPIGFGKIGPDYKFTPLTENALGCDLSDRIRKAWWDHVLDLETEPRNGALFGQRSIPVNVP